MMDRCAVTLAHAGKFGQLVPHAGRKQQLAADELLTIARADRKCGCKRLICRAFQTRGLDHFSGEDPHAIGLDLPAANASEFFRPNAIVPQKAVDVTRRGISWMPCVDQDDLATSAAEHE